MSLDSRVRSYLCGEPATSGMSSPLLPCLASLLLLVIPSAMLNQSPRLTDQLEHVVTATPDTLSDLISSTNVSLIFFYRKEPSKYRQFLKAYNDSAQKLQHYNVQLAVFDCMGREDTESICRNKVDDHVFTYQNGISLMSLEMEFLFDVNSIMANALLLVLLHEVPIIQSRLERQELQRSLVGKRDLLFINPQAVGTAEHRVFLEVAHAYQDHFAFALTTDYRTVLGLQDSEELTPDSSLGLWVMFCSSADPASVMELGDCPHTMYRSRLSLVGLAAFAQKLLQQPVYHAPRDGTDSLFAMTSNDPIVYVYVRSEEKEQQDSPALKHLLNFDLRGSATVIFVHMDDRKCLAAALQQGLDGSIPNIGVRTHDGRMHFLNPVKWSDSEIKTLLSPHVFPDWVASKTKSGDRHKASSLTAPQKRSIQDEIDALIEEVETQDDPVAEAVFSLRHKEMPGLSRVPALLKNNFTRTVKRSTLLMVLFYQPYDHVSMAFLRDYGNAAETLASHFSTPDTLARVNCFDATDLCSAENITVYPTVRVYRQDPARPQSYAGPLEAGAVTRAVKLLQLNSPVLLTTEDEVDQFSKGHYPSDFSKFTPSSIILLATDAESVPVTMFKEVCTSMCQVTALGIVHPSLVPHFAEKYKTAVPSLVAHNRVDEALPIRTLALVEGETTASAVSEFVRAATIPVVPELVPANFPHLYARQLPMAVLFVDTSDVATKEVAVATFTDVATSGQYPGLLFCWMDAQVKSIGLKILSEYTWTAQLPMVSVVKHRQGQVYNFQPSGSRQGSVIPLEAESFRSWLDKVVAGQVQPSKILDKGKWGPPGRHYNFLDQRQNLGGAHLDRESIGRTGTRVVSEKDPAEEVEAGDTVVEDVEEDDLEMEQVVRGMLLELRKLHKPLQQPPQQQQQQQQQQPEVPMSPVNGHTEL